MQYNIISHNVWEAGAKAEPGVNRRQEDWLYPANDAQGPDNTTFVVCDGLGGPGYGDVASSTVCDTIGRYLSGYEGIVTPQVLLDAINEAYDMLGHASCGAGSRMGTTMALARITGQTALIAHIGNSRVYHIRPGADAESTVILHTTTDHTLANYVVSRGEMTADQAIRSGKHKVLIRAMQPDMANRCQPDIYQTSDLRVGDCLLLCTDGMLEHLDTRDLRSMFSAAGGSDIDRTRTLRRITANNQDDHTAIIVRIAQDAPPRADSAVHPGQQPRRVAPMPPTPQPTPTAPSDNGPRPNPVTPQPMTQPAPGAHRPAKTRSSLSRSASQALHNPNLSDATKHNKLQIKALICVLAFTTVCMIIYYAFIHRDEQLQQAGTGAIPTNIINPSQHDDAETYGYETTAADYWQEAPTYDPGDTEADAEADTEPTERPADEPADEPTAESEPTPQPAPQHPDNEPILQE